MGRGKHSVPLAAILSYLNTGKNEINFNVTNKEILGPYWHVVMTHTCELGSPRDLNNQFQVVEGPEHFDWDAPPPSTCKIVQVP